MNNRLIRKLFLKLVNINLTTIMKSILKYINIKYMWLGFAVNIPYSSWQKAHTLERQINSELNVWHNGSPTGSDEDKKQRREEKVQKLINEWITLTDKIETKGGEEEPSETVKRYEEIVGKTQKERNSRTRPVIWWGNVYKTILAIMSVVILCGNFIELFKD